MNSLSTKELRTVVSCYDFLHLSIQTGIEDFTEGIYMGDPNRPYQEAQRLQIEYLLDEIGCHEGSCILDIGCGYGTLLESARERGATAIGITISQPQVNRCREKGLDVHLMNYRNIPQEWNNRFDGIVANGSAEHFVQAKEAAAGLQDTIYRDFFQICHRIIDPSSKNGKLATTIIHYNKQVDPKSLLGCPFRHEWGSDDFHYSMLMNGFGGFYPVKNQLEHCAQGCFTLEHEVDGTHDYHLTSEYWLKQMQKYVRTHQGAWLGLLGKMLKRPIHTITMLTCLLISKSWNWQFRTDNPPTTLLRQTWKYSD
jgi:cyclopropane fatty-acyl-phospholipid synthase-like methyltransferase